MNTGIFITFRDEHDGAQRELPPVGPLDHLVLRHRTLVCERTSVQQADDLGVPIDRWLEAELELQRAMGSEPGGARRAHMRITARDGVLVRFAVFGDPAERDPVPELGPYAVVHVGKHAIEADGQVLATRKASDIAPWELASAAGTDHAGLSKADVAFRTPTTAYHPAIAAAPTSPAPVVEEHARPRTSLLTGAAPAPDTPPAPVEPAPPTVIEIAPAPPPIEIAPAPRVAEAPPPVIAAPPVVEVPQPRERYTPPPAPQAEQPPALTEDDRELIRRIERDRQEETLRARVQEEERRRLGVTSSPDDPATTWAMRYRAAPEATDDAAAPATPQYEFELRDLLWRLRIPIVGVLLLLAGFYGFVLLRGGGTVAIGPGATTVRTVGIAEHVQSDNWEYVVNGTQRVQQAGSATPSGVYYVVRIGVTNRRAEGLSLSPTEFSLVAPDGTRYAAVGLASGAYQGPGNTGSPYFWPQSFPVGKNVTMGIIFDVPPSLDRGLQLTLPDLPNVRVKLD